MRPTATAQLDGARHDPRTCQYMAPEQLEGREADARTDIFAFGAVLYEMLDREEGVRGQQPRERECRDHSSRPDAVSAPQPLAPPVLDRVVATCLAKDPDERWQSAGDLARELKWITEDGSLPPRPDASLAGGGHGWRLSLLRSQLV